MLKVEKGKLYLLTRATWVISFDANDIRTEEERVVDPNTVMMALEKPRGRFYLDPVRDAASGNILTYDKALLWTCKFLIEDKVWDIGLGVESTKEFNKWFFGELAKRLERTDSV